MRTELFFYCVLYKISYLAATATATATAMLKMDENVNLRLQRHVNPSSFLLFTAFLLAQVCMFFKILGSE